MGVATANTAAGVGAKPILAKITTRVDVESKADCQNIARQAAIGAKEGTAADISKHVGTDVTDVTDVTDSVLRKADGNAKKVEEWHLHKITTEMITAAYRPATTSVLDALVEILQW